ncbi:ComEC/Rec2 family competence protein [Kitasatospora sp. NPDC002227]|uniref:ComEC/Rec2 family competence protein n=1 Tax=Kitasatospora sp. NPDC002227 TaxID=3154773 RepID=UPI00332087FF
MQTDLRLVPPALAAWAVTAATLAVPPAYRPALPLAALAAAATAVLLLSLTGPRRRTAATAAATLLTAAAATFTTLLHTADLHRGPIPALTSPTAPNATATTATQPDLSLDLTVGSDPKPHPARAQPLLTLRATVERVDSPDLPAPVRTRTPVTLMVRAQDVPAWQPLLPSTRLRSAARILPPDPDPDRPDRTRTTAAVLLVRGPPQILARPSLPQRLAGRFRADLRRACDHLPAEARGLLPGLVVGDTSRLPDDLAQAFRATDLGHLTAVSGANLAIVLTVLVGSATRLEEPTELDPLPTRPGLAGALGLSLRTTAILGTAVTLAFVTICRPDPSVLRAAATGLIGLLALATGRPRQALTALAGAVLALVLLDPYLARSYGFVLSGLATTGLLTLGPRWQAALLARRWPRHLAAAVVATAAAQALCAPVTVLLAPRVSLVAVPCNVLAEAAVAPATLLGFGALALGPLWPSAARFLADLAAVPTAWLAAVARHGAALPGAQLDLPAGLFGAAVLALATLALSWAAHPFAARRRPRRPHPPRRALRTTLLGTALTAALLAVLLRPPLLTRIATGWPPSGWRLVMCDVGQGDMTVLPVGAADGTAVVVDTGPDPAAADSCLRSLGVTSVPLVILSHFFS